MKELLIHQTSRLFYADTAQSFVYVCEHYEVVLFSCEGIRVDTATLSSQQHDCMMLQQHQMYTFHMPEKGILLMTKLPLQEDRFVYRFYQSFFQHQEIQSLCILIGDMTGTMDEKSQLLLQAYHARLGFLVLNSYAYLQDQEEDQPSSFTGERLRIIHQIIMDHVQEELTLVELADELHLTPQYVSQYFKRNFGMSFLHYRNRMKLYAAIEEIQHTNQSFLTIAMHYGFANIRSFQTAFVECFHCTPKQYRKLLQQQSLTKKERVEEKAYLEFMDEMKGSVPTRYRNQMEQHDRLQFIVKEGTPIKHTWRNLMTVGRARLLLVDDIRRQLTQIQEEIGFKMIRFHGIFNDDMQVYEEDQQGNPIYNFHLVNEALDFVLKLGLKPFVELGFMPSMLAKYPDMTILNRIFLVSPPKDMKKWQLLVGAFLKNCINRYGLDEVLSWYFEFWNNAGLENKEEDDPHTRKDLFWQESAKSYMEFYQATYVAVKQIHKNLRIGGPSVDASLLQHHPELLDDFLRYIKKHDCMLDFITLHIYPQLLIGADLQQSIQYFAISESFQQSIQAINAYIKKRKLPTEVHITEWSTWGSQAIEGFNDGCGKATYIIKSIVHTLDQVHSIGHWTFSDYTETMKTRPSDIYSDNVGLFTSNGIKKAAYHAYTLLNKLGDELLDKGKNYIVTRKQKNYQVLLFHNASSIEKKDEIACIQFSIQGIENGTYEKKVYFLNEQSGSSYDVWKQMGSHQNIMEEDVAYLKAHAMMSYKREVVQIAQHQDHETRRLKHQEAMLIEWIYKY